MGAASLPRLRQLIRIGARRSRLSRWMANHFADLLKTLELNARIEIREYSTRGDLNPTAPLPTLGLKGVFTEALEAALRRREIDCAVHSLKDLPVEDADDLSLVAVPKRGDHRDALVSRSGATLEDLPRGARIGTGSLRRRAQLLAIRPDLEILSIRGNVPTRLKKLHTDDSPYDALVLAVAGLQRLGLAAHISQAFEAQQMLSAAGQGALAVQCLNEPELLRFFGRLTDRETVQAVSAERAFLGALEVGCSAPVAAYARIHDSQLEMRGRVLSAEGARQIDVHGEAPIGEETDGIHAALRLGKRLAAHALAQGADQLSSGRSPETPPNNL